MKLQKNYTFLVLSFLFFFSFSIFAQEKKSFRKETTRQTDKRLNTLFAQIPTGVWVDEKGEKVEMNAFQLEIRTVTNFDYRQFTDFLKQNKEMEKYHAFYPDSTVWSKGLEKMGSVYFRHSAYNLYPVIGITKEAALAYADWLGMMNRTISENQEIVFRLPTKSEWMYAACTGNQGQKYAWNGDYLRNDKGVYLANFQSVGEESVRAGEDGNPIIVRTSLNSENAHSMQHLMSPSQSYPPNSWGLYNLNGNVEEMLLDADEVIGGSWLDYGYDIRNSSVKPYHGEAKMTVGFRLVRIK